jgi:hypothetical protein
MRENAAADHVGQNFVRLIRRSSPSETRARAQFDRPLRVRLLDLFAAEIWPRMLEGIDQREGITGAAKHGRGQ